ARIPSAASIFGSTTGRSASVDPSVRATSSRPSVESLHCARGRHSRGHTHIGPPPPFPDQMNRSHPPFEEPPLPDAPPLLTARQMQQWDESAIQRSGIPERVLMETAG